MIMGYNAQKTGVTEHQYSIVSKEWRLFRHITALPVYVFRMILTVVIEFLFAIGSETHERNQ